MWARRLTAPRTFSVIEAPEPIARVDGEVIVRPIVGGVCGSDLPYFLGRNVPNPLLPATLTGGDFSAGQPLHEILAEVVDSLDPERRPGELVVGWATGLDGFAELVRTHGNNLTPAPSHVPPEVGILVQPLACVIEVVDDLDLRGVDHVAVIGMGPIGQLFAHVLKDRGIDRVTGVDRLDRSSRAVPMGCDEFVHRSSDRWSLELAESDRPKVVIEAAGHNVATLTDAITAVAENGHVFAFGVPDDPVYPFPMSMFLRKHLSLASGVTRTETRARRLRQAVDYLLTHPDLEQGYVTDVMSVDDAHDAYNAAVNPRPDQGKVVMRF